MRAILRWSPGSTATTCSMPPVASLVKVCVVAFRSNGMAEAAGDAIGCCLALSVLSVWCASLAHPAETRASTGIMPRSHLRRRWLSVTLAGVVMGCLHKKGQGVDDGLALVGGDGLQQVGEAGRSGSGQLASCLAAGV